jgi:hypothetical protein
MEICRVLRNMRNTLQQSIKLLTINNLSADNILSVTKYCQQFRLEIIALTLISLKYLQCIIIACNNYLFPIFSVDRGNGPNLAFYEETAFCRR